MQKMKVFYMILIINIISVFLIRSISVSKPFTGNIIGDLSAIYHRLMTICRRFVGVLWRFMAFYGVLSAKIRRNQLYLRLKISDATKAARALSTSLKSMALLIFSSTTSVFISISADISSSTSIL